MHSSCKLKTEHSSCKLKKDFLSVKLKCYKLIGYRYRLTYCRWVGEEMYILYVV